MFIKKGDLQPISIVEPSDIDDKNTKKELKKILDQAVEQKTDSFTGIEEGKK